MKKYKALSRTVWLAIIAIIIIVVAGIAGVWYFLQPTTKPELTVFSLWTGGGQEEANFKVALQKIYR
jgi:hypothetical protein